MGLLEVCGKTEALIDNKTSLQTQGDFLSATNLASIASIPTSDSDDSGSIDLTCQEDAPSSPSMYINDT